MSTHANDGVVDKDTTQSGHAPLEAFQVILPYTARGQYGRSANGSIRGADAAAIEIEAGVVGEYTSITPSG